MMIRTASDLTVLFRGYKTNGIIRITKLTELQHTAASNMASMQGALGLLVLREAMKASGPHNMLCNQKKAGRAARHLWRQKA